MAKGDFIDISLLGGKELQATFLELPSKLQKSIVRKANTKAMRPIFRAIKRRVPILTGRLQRGIKTRAIKATRRNKTVGRILFLPERSLLGIAPSAKVYPPAAVEYGHDNVAEVSFVRKGFDEAEAQAAQILEVEITSGIQREWKKLGRKVLTGSA